jgi:tripartite-type tricarboxylate transporter receptor subunit TctC
VLDEWFAAIAGCSVRRLALLLAAVALCAQAAYPEKPIRFVVPSAAGGSPDVLMRILAQQLSQQMSVPIVVENKPGASFVLGTMDIVKAAPDGYTLGYGNIVSLAINRSLLASVPYDVEKDLTLVSNCVRVFNLLAVNNRLPVRTVPELIEYAKRNPGRLTMGSGGNGTTGHLGGELFKAMTGTFIVHVPYRGSPQAINDLMAGEIHLMFDNLSSIAPHAKSGRVRGIAVSGPRRSPVFPDLPTIAEAGVPGYETVAWGGVIGPANLPAGMVSRLNKEIGIALANPALVERYRQLDTEIDGGTPEEFLALVRRETPKWAEVVRRSGAKMD